MQAMLDCRPPHPNRIGPRPAITSVRPEHERLVGSSSVTAMNAYVSQIPADVQWVAYNEHECVRPGQRRAVASGRAFPRRQPVVSVQP
jgi:hypothetical protein